MHISYMCMNMTGLVIPVKYEKKKKKKKKEKKKGSSKLLKYRQGNLIFPKPIYGRHLLL